MHFRRFKIGHRTAAGFVVALAFILGLGLFSLKQMSAIAQSSAEIAEDWLPRQRVLGEIQSSLNFFRTQELLHVMAEFNQEIIDADERMKAAQNKLEGLMADYKKILESEQEKNLFETLTASWKSYLETHDEMIGLSRVKFKEEAREMMTGPSNERLEQLRKVYVDLSDFVASGADSAKGRASELYSATKELMIIAIALAAVITFTFALVLTRSINKPLKSVLSAARRIARNDLTQTIEVEGQDEISDLQKALAEMQDRLRKTLQKVTSAAAQVASASENLNALTEDATNALNMQNSEIQMAATAVTEMSTAVDDVAKHANDASEASQAAESASTSGRKQVGETKQSLEELTNSVTSTGGEIQALANQVGEISRVLDVIGSIADQTNLLALNAAIEAARAGEQGRGFSVVADEVRALAHRTQESTREITQMIDNIQSVTRKAVNSMTASNEHTHKTLSLAEAADGALEEIMRMVGRINEMNLSIASASEEQAHVAREVDRNLVNIRDVADHTAEGAQKTSAASHELADLAHDLNGIVAGFKL
ncbi:Methyl-accepting chemotaxis protein [Hahella chejuensis KCTC 2396]|uniref:Methyl-accepting chemotaxis protein n=1 Tax=Hahella chejuensis (strain KCTC 2396) TaxID=349521 RepID=Q2SQR9_HAHCH|nr:methyl-accepting chemotaxis protein [Hahella chejuensis]ABC27005.1 Methyl-accepting chemotaxis protein [Hahella chejuensis KCTC 2396]